MSHIKKIYLTVDDFPTRKSKEMLYFLQKKDINCIFFCIGIELERQENLALEALSMGFLLGNHSYSHKTFSKLSLRSAYKEIEKTHYLLEKIYDKAGIPWIKKYFRFPYGDKGDGNFGKIFNRANDPKKRLKKIKIQKRLKELCYDNYGNQSVSYSYYKNILEKERDLHWTLDVMEWCLKRHNGMFNITGEADVLRRLFSKNPFDCRGEVPEEDYGLPFTSSSEVILMHDCDKTFAVFRTVIHELENRGYIFGKF